MRTDPCATSHQRHDAGASSVLHLPENNSWFWWMLAVRAATVENGTTASATAVPVLSETTSSSSCTSWALSSAASSSSWRMRSVSSAGSSSTSSVSSKSVEVLASGSLRKHWCHFECPREVEPSPRCDACLFFHLFAGVQKPLLHEALHGAEAQVKHRTVPAHGVRKKMHGLLFDDVLEGLLD